MRLHGSLLGAFTAFSVLTACAPDHLPGGGEGLPVLVRNSIRPEASLQALAHGRLQLDPGGCLRIGEGGPFVIWPRDSRISRTEDGRAQVIDGLSGNAVRVGEEFAVAGAGVAVAPTQLTQPVPPACTNGEYWLAGPVLDEVDRLAMFDRAEKTRAGRGAPAPVQP